MTGKATFCEPLYLQGFTDRERYNAGVSAQDAVLQKLQQAGIRPTQLGKAIGVSKQQASMMLAGQRGIPTWHLDAIAELLNTSVPNLFVPELKQEKIAELVTSPVPVAGVSSDFTPRGSTDGHSAPLRSPLNIAEEIHAHAAALTELALRIARDAGRAARGRAESSPLGAPRAQSLPKRAAGRRHR